MIKITELIRYRFRQAGFTLMELMISIVIGLIILAAVMGLFVAMIHSDNDSLKSIRLHHELRAAMSLITRDMRRAGANQGAAAIYAAPPPYVNPFSVIGTTRLAIASNQEGKANTCITYSYDANDGSNGLLGYGYRWNCANKTIEARNVGAACGSVVATDWTSIIDSDLIEITDGKLIAGVEATCDDADPPRGLLFTDNTIVESGSNIREITVTLWGRLKRDVSVMHSVSETVRIRNDEIVPTPTPAPTPTP